MTVFHVSPAGSDGQLGSESAPFRTINRAANAAMPGDTVLVHAGTYREWVRPTRGGRSEHRRITYAAAPGEQPVIKGSEHVTAWDEYAEDLWCTHIPASMFGAFNPFAEELDGDWIVYSPGAPKKHLGQVFLNGMRLYEAEKPLVSTKRDCKQAGSNGTRAAIDGLEGDVVPPHEVKDNWTGLTHAIDPEPRKRVWWADVGETETVIWARFAGADPRIEFVEVTVRPAVFFPEHPGCDYITVRGFEMAHAATQWAPPTAKQIGLIGPNWAKGWIIEDNTIHDSRCSGISLGKEASSGQNFSTTRRDLPGYQYQLESVFQGLKRGWNRELVGSHIVRRNRIFNCGQTGIVGHMGAAFSVIEDNDIWEIGHDAEFFGHEIAGIKLHAAIDVQLRHNRIRRCFLGMWLDWETQGTRITRNLVYQNWRDFFVEVSHGPYVVDNNVFASPISLEILAQGGAYIHNLVAGAVRIDSVPLRSTPYHFPHSTAIAGCAVVYGGDDRFIGNVFMSGDIAGTFAGQGAANPKLGYGTAMYAGHPASREEFEARLDEAALRAPGDIEMYLQVEQPVYIQGNTYAAGATPYPSETDPAVLDFPISMRITEVSAAPSVDGELVGGGGLDGLPVGGHGSDGETGDALGSGIACPETWIQFFGVQYPGERSSNGENVVGENPVPEHNGERILLPPARIAGQEFEDPEGNPYCFAVDLIGARREEGKPSVHGPLASWPRDAESIRVWQAAPWESDSTGTDGE